MKSINDLEFFKKNISLSLNLYFKNSLKLLNNWFMHKKYPTIWVCLLIFIPGFLLCDNNLIRVASFATCGITGCIEYTTLAFVKHNKIETLRQKKICSYLYNYIRYPLSMYSMISIYIVYRQGMIKNINPILLLYINLIIFFNGAFYNKLTIENYIVHKSRIQNNYELLKRQ